MIELLRAEPAALTVGGLSCRRLAGRHWRRSWTWPPESGHGETASRVPEEPALSER
ncbi:uncharacterized protein BDV14DRAFT_177552 [Aspergillus stella-maris]|uniref:uncharacterized protein n=1 Tax=Aspergillus stella-maris TaxID=1810926 RepID=UPI003CCDD1A4